MAQFGAMAAISAPIFSAQSLHILALDLADRIAHERLSRGYPDLKPEEKAAIEGAVALDLKANRYDPASARWLCRRVRPSPSTAWSNTGRDISTSPRQMAASPERQ